MITTVAVEGYRSLRRVVLPLGGLTVVTGANGTGKSSLYRALRLLSEVALGGAIGAVAREGGLASTLWAGPETTGRGVRSGEHPVQGTVRRGPVSLRLGFASDHLGYAVDLGLPKEGGAFRHDPEIKVEAIWSGPLARPGTIAVDRHGGVVRARDDDGRLDLLVSNLRPFDSLLTEVVDAARAPEVLVVREQLRSWRFYDHLRSDAAAPARHEHVGTRTPVLAHDGADVAAALQTIRDLGRGDELDEAVDGAFPGAEIDVEHADGRFRLAFHQPGLLRPLSGAELSDGTLRYLLWVAALLSPRPAELLVLNEPETSLHPDLLPALARLVVAAAQRSQVVVVTHSAELREALRTTSATEVELVRELGATVVAGRQGPLDEPGWVWPGR